MKKPSKIEKAGKGVAPEVAAEDAAAKAAQIDHSLKERRGFVRPLPVPLATESERDSTWALFQELSEAPPAQLPESKTDS
jgi:hypothetical protein